MLHLNLPLFDFVHQCAPNGFCEDVHGLQRRKTEYNETNVPYLGGTPPNPKKLQKNKPPNAKRQASEKQHIGQGKHP